MWACDQGQEKWCISWRKDRVLDQAVSHSGAIREGLSLQHSFARVEVSLSLLHQPFDFWTADSGAPWLISFNREIGVVWHSISMSCG